MERLVLGLLLRWALLFAFCGRDATKDWPSKLPWLICQGNFFIG
jgi:hypothetical protein